MTDKYTINKIYTGSIIHNNNVINLTEYKLAPSIYKFKKCNYHCMWFINNDMLQPININIEEIRKGKRIIADNDYPDLCGLEIVDIKKCNDVVSPTEKNNISKFID